MPELATDYMGLKLRVPLVASSSPLTGDLDGLRRLEDAGAAAAILPSLFEEQLSHEAMEIDRMLETGAETFGEATSYFPELEDYDSGPDRYLELIANAKDAVEIPIIASLNGATPGGWLEHARRIEEAGADALELNLYLVAADPDRTAMEIEAADREIVYQVRQSIEIPLSVKLSPYFTALAHTARELAAIGANGLTLFNRFYQPDLDINTREVVPHLELSRSSDVRLPLRWIAILHGRVEAALAASSGVHTAKDVIKVLLAGADVAMLASALLENGPGHLRQIETDLLEWMSEHAYESVSQLRGSVSQRSAPDPTAFERGNYVRMLKSYSSRFGA
jgi:dihydroorotate dehydrogenase (fumarate)